jgi:C1A family cysteine protease
MNDFPAIESGGERRILSCLPTPGNVFRSFSPYSARREPIPQSEWREFDRWPALKHPIKDQNGIGACMGHGTATAMELAYRIAYGKLVQFSAWFVYATINGGQDRGATVGDAFESIRENGVCLDSSVPWKEWRPSRAITPKTKAEAANYKAEHIYKMDTEADLATAVLCADPVAFGTMIGQGFDKLDGEGVPGSGGGQGGHAMTIFGGMKKLRSGRWAYRVVNSWKRDWGIDGCCWMTYPQIGGTEFGLDAFAIVHPVPSPDHGPPKVES